MSVWTRRALFHSSWTVTPVSSPSGRLPSGETFSNFEELKQLLISSQREKVTRATVRRMMAYALCRRLEYYDRPAVEAIVDQLMANDGTFRDLINGIVLSLPFQKTVGQIQIENEES